MRVYHFLSGDFALSDLRLKRIKVSRFRDLNDPFELLGADLTDREERRLFRQYKKDLDKHFGVLCFSRSWRNPLLWSHYANKHRGICLGFDVSKSQLREIKYVSGRPKIKPNHYLKSSEGRHETAVDLLITKFADWEYEDEIRMILKLKNTVRDPSGMFFLPFSSKLQLRRVVIGPRCKISPDEIRACLKDTQRNVILIKARLAFSTFQVVTNKSATERL